MTEIPQRRKVLLMLLPFWDPMIPPLGIACLKSYIAKDDGFEVKTIDANVEDGFREIYIRYFDALKKSIPEDKRRHMYNIGHEVMKNHFMAHQFKTDESDYLHLLETIIAKTFYHQVDGKSLSEFAQIADDFYRLLNQYISNILNLEKPDVIGLSVYGSTLQASLYALKLVKEKNPQIKTYIGGGIFSGELAIDSPDFQFLLEKAPFIDKIVVGEGEKLFYALLKNEISTNKKVYTREDLPAEPFSIEDAPLPDFSDFNLEYYAKMPSYTSRSCPFECNFCVETTYWGKYRKKSAGKIVAELIALKQKYGRHLYLMCDSLLNPVIDDLAAEFHKYQEAIYWGGYLRVAENICNPENTISWRRGGFYRARLGVESGSKRILELMRKKITIEQVKDAITSLAYAGIKTTVMFVIGYPGETEEDFLMTLNLVQEMRDDIYEADCNPFWYFKAGQINSDFWGKNNHSVRLYPENARDMLLTQTWILTGQPEREVTYNRVNRFIEHCHKWRIPDPYTLKDTHKADERWKKLHKNAVPGLLEILMNNFDKNDIKNVKALHLTDKKIVDNEVWEF